MYSDPPYLLSNSPIFPELAAWVRDFTVLYTYSVKEGRATEFS